MESKKSKITNIFTLLVLLFTAFQGLIPTIPLSNETTLTILSAVTLFLVSGLTAWKQALSVEISNDSLKPTIIVAIVATLGSLNDLFNVVPVSAMAGQWIRFVITLITLFLNLASKVLWPTAETKSTL